MTKRMVAAAVAVLSMTATGCSMFPGATLCIPGSMNDCSTAARAPYPPAPYPAPAPYPTPPRYPAPAPDPAPPPWHLPAPAPQPPAGPGTVASTPPGAGTIQLSIPCLPIPGIVQCGAPT